MFRPIVDFIPDEPLSLSTKEIVEDITVISHDQIPTKTLIPLETITKISKQEIRSSLSYSTLDGVFANIFGCVTSGVLLTNFLLQLGATSLEIGLLAALPMVANFVQPVGAYLADKTTSRQKYNLWLFGLSRLLWLILVVLIGWNYWDNYSAEWLIKWTLGIALGASVLAALSCASWISWMSVLVPHRLRGSYFGFRNSAASLTNLLCIPLMGLVVSTWTKGSIQGYGILLLIGVLAGFISLGFQLAMTDVNPQAPISLKKQTIIVVSSDISPQIPENKLWKDPNFLKFLLYFGTWTFAVNISNPFFNIYLLKDLELDVSWVTIYTSLTAVANLIMLIGWGKLADRLGNRPVLIFVGVLVAITPLLWLGTGNNSFCLWVCFPLLYLLTGGTWAAIDLCSNNIQMEIAPSRQPSSYFAIAAAVAGVAGTLGTTAGGAIAELPSLGGLSSLFILSAVLRLIALLPLIFVREMRSPALS